MNHAETVIDPEIYFWTRYLLLWLTCFALLCIACGVRELCRARQR